MQREELINLSEYELSLLSVHHATDPKIANTIIGIYHDFNDEYKKIVENRHNHTCLTIQEAYLTSVLSSGASKSKKDEALEVVDKSFQEKDKDMVRLCNLKFDWLVKCGVFVKK